MEIDAPFEPRDRAFRALAFLACATEVALVVFFARLLRIDGDGPPSHWIDGFGFAATGVLYLLSYGGALIGCFLVKGSGFRREVWCLNLLASFVAFSLIGSWL